jgi:tRNA-2-methylthio-N6-dimethylallyladenosine synthase
MNEYDSQRLAQGLLDAGWIRAASEIEADLLVANTCTVRQLAEHKAFSLLGRWIQWKKDRPNLLIGMVGCLAQHLQESSFRRMPGIDFLAGPRAVSHVPQLAEQSLQHKHLSAFDIFDFGPAPQSRAARSIAMVAAMEGCDQFCTYCAVPRARGRETSRTPDAILREARSRVEEGALEIILLGQTINRYGHDLVEMDFPNLLQQLAAVDGVSRIRFLTSHPGYFSDRLLETMARTPQICPALHLPVQSGSDSILKTMRRGYTSEAYVNLTRRIHEAVPGIALSTDIIVGFPGETDADFQATLDLVNASRIEAAYCFKFSARSGTVAALLADQVPAAIQEQRLEVLLRQIDAQALAAKSRLVGNHDCVLVERCEEKDGTCWLLGRTPSNHVVKFAGPPAWIGQEIRVQITAASHWTLYAETEETKP